jgi:hypothetical protein
VHHDPPISRVWPIARIRSSICEFPSFIYARAADNWAYSTMSRMSTTNALLLMRYYRPILPGMHAKHHHFMFRADCGRRPRGRCIYPLSRLLLALWSGYSLRYDKVMLIRLWFWIGVDTVIRRIWFRTGLDSVLVARVLRQRVRGC